MNHLNQKQLRAEVVEYTQKDNRKATAILLAELAVYIASIIGIIYFDNIMLKILLSVVGGLKIATLFAIAHDAAHASYVKGRVLNKIIARLTFLPSLHNYSLWLLAHNKTHHQSTNAQTGNSWTPMSKDEYDELSEWRKLVEKLYRSVFGIGFYYTVERWWKDKFFPYKRLVEKNRGRYFLDFLLVTGYLGIYLSILTIAGMNAVGTSVMEMVFFAFILPLSIGHYMIGFTVYEQHTHETLPWFKTKDERDLSVSIEELTMHVKFPHWYGVLSLNVMEHTVHHLDSRIPVYNLANAQRKIAKLLGDELISVDFTISDFLVTMSKCKLYDYDNHQWLDFDGLPTSDKCYHEEEVKIEYAQAA